MNQRCWRQMTVLVAVVVFVNILSCDCAPAYKIKHYNMHKPKYGSSSRAERRLVGGSSPIHFINPFMPMQKHPVRSFDTFFVPPVPVGKQPMSTIYKLPLQLLANGKPQRILHVKPRNHSSNDFFPHGASNIIRLPLKFVSNAKPVGIYLRDRFMNYV